MAEEKHHHGLFHHHKDGDQENRSNLETESGGYNKPSSYSAGDGYDSGNYNKKSSYSTDENVNVSGGDYETGYNKTDTAYSTNEPSGGGYNSGGYNKSSYDQPSGGGDRYSETKTTAGGGYGSGGGYGDGGYSETKTTAGGGYGGDDVDYRKEEKHHKHLEEIGELGTAAAGAYALANPDYKGVCHVAVAQEGHRRPGEVLLGTDSHTTSAGAFGQFATGIGNTDAAFISGTGKILLKGREIDADVEEEDAEAMDFINVLKYGDLAQVIQRPSQELVSKDLHGLEWRFRHIYRGQPRRHLLTTGWSAFVNKKLVSGDAVLYLRGDDGELRLGIRRAAQLKSAGFFAAI